MATSNRRTTGTGKTSKTAKVDGKQTGAFTPQAQNTYAPNVIQKATNTVGSNLGKTELITSSKIGDMSMVNASQIDKKDEEQFRQKQMDFASALQAQISGTAGPSAAMVQFQRSVDQNIAAQMAIAHSGGGPLALRQALTNTATLNQQAAADASALRAKEIQAAQGQLADVLNQGRTADINLAENQAQLDQQANLANQQAANTKTESQAQLDEQANLADQSAINNRNIVQGQLNTSIHNTDTQAAAQRFAASTSAAATVRAAGIGAAAENNATAAANYRFNMGAILQLDQNAYSNSINSAKGSYDVNTDAAAKKQQAIDQINANLNAAGGSVADASKYGGGTGGGSGGGGVAGAGAAGG